MRARWVLAAAAMTIAPLSCGDDGGNGNPSSSSSSLSWRCYVSPVGGCECKLATDEELEAAGYDKSSFPDSSCPVTSYKCCESREKGAYFDGTKTCVCWNPQSIPFCDGTNTIVPKCPP
jgi:hypothetical protein